MAKWLFITAADGREMAVTFHAAGRSRVASPVPPDCLTQGTTNAATRLYTGVSLTPGNGMTNPESKLKHD